MNISNLKKVEIRGKKVVKTGIRLVIRRGSTKEEWVIPLSRPKIEEQSPQVVLPISSSDRRIKKGVSLR
jgi:hypothetical protein